MASSEDIEARLCAYIEGEVDPAEKEQIEHHLQDHPRHREMIEDLIRTRQLVAALPRVKAPADLSDGLYGQLERSALLGQTDDPQWRAQARHLPKVAVMAAISLLTVGLAVVVLWVVRGNAVPDHSVSPVALVVAPPPSTQPVIAAATSMADVPALGSIFQPDTTRITLIEQGPEIDELLDFVGPPLAQPTTQPTDLAAGNPSTQPTTQPVAVDGDVQ